MWPEKKRKTKVNCAFSPSRLSMQLWLWLPDPKAKWLRTTWMYSKISGRSRYASWPKLWMTSPLWTTSCLFQVSTTEPQWGYWSWIRKHLQIFAVLLLLIFEQSSFFLLFLSLYREPHSGRCQQMCNCSTRRRCWHSGPNCRSHQGKSCSCSPHHQCWNGKLRTWSLYWACAGVHQASVWNRLVN